MNRSVKNGQRTKHPLMQETKGNYIRGGVEFRQDLCANQFADSSHTNAGKEVESCARICHTDGMP